MIVLVSWEVWKEYNVRVFQHHRWPVTDIFTRIRDEARAWCLAGSNFLGNVIQAEYTSLFEILIALPKHLSLKYLH
jgi:hypothetical protein